MRIHIEKDIYLSADGRQYTLERCRIAQSGKNEGEEVFAPFAYYMTLEGAVRCLVKHKISESTATTLNELLASVERMKEDILAVVEHGATKI